MASKLVCFLSCACVTNVVVCPPKRKKKCRDAPLATEVTVRATGPLPLPPPGRRAYGNDKQFFYFVFSLIMSTVRWRRCCRSGDSFFSLCGCIQCKQKQTLSLFGSVRLFLCVSKHCGWGEVEWRGKNSVERQID